MISQEEFLLIFITDFAFSSFVTQSTNFVAKSLFLKNLLHAILLHQQTFSLVDHLVILASVLSHNQCLPFPWLECPWTIHNRCSFSFIEQSISCRPPDSPIIPFGNKFSLYHFGYIPFLGPLRYYLIRYHLYLVFHPSHQIHNRPYQYKCIRKIQIIS